VPDHWPELTIEYRYGSSLYVITVREPGAAREHGAGVTLDGNALNGAAIPLLDDGKRHDVVIEPSLINR